MSQTLKSLTARLEAFPDEDRERAIAALEERLSEIEVAKRDALRRDLDAGIKQAQAGKTVAGEESFEKIRRKHNL